MKRWFHIAFLSCIVAFSACNRPVETQNFASPPPADPALQAIDSLMWQQPDSALACLLPWFDTCGDAIHCVSTTYDRHYAHLLLAELLYKNDYAQSNRAELRQAVAYFDSLAFALNDAPNPCDPLFFLAARAHYINGVGYYEADGLVEACTEYLTALETMEGRFKKKEFVKDKARFMTLTNNRLVELFSNLFMQEPAIACAKQSLYYDKIEPTSPYNRANILYRIGLQYDKLKIIDSASYYYDIALQSFPNRTSVAYRDLIASRALYEYSVHNNIITALDSLKNIASKTNDAEEKAGRFFAIGTIYYAERQFDSAKFYLEPVYEKGTNCKKLAAERLREIALSEGDTLKAIEYAEILLEHTNMEAESNAIVSQLEGLFKNYINRKEKRLDHQKRNNTILYASVIIVITAAIIVSFIVFCMKRNSKKRMKTAQHEEEKRHTEALEAVQQRHHWEKAALMGRLRQSNKELRELKEKIKRQDNTTSVTHQSISFENEPVCQLILERVKEGQFKSQMNCAIYKEYALDKEDILALRETIDYHFSQFTTRMSEAFPELTHTDIDYCCLYFLGLSDADVSALMQKAYSTISDRSRKLRSVFGNVKSLPTVLRAFGKQSFL